MLLLTARFRVLSGATHNHTHSGVLRLTALELLNQGSFRFVENATAEVILSIIITQPQR